MLLSSKICCKPSRGPITSNYSTTVPVCCIRSVLRVWVPFARRAAQQCAVAVGRLEITTFFSFFQCFGGKFGFKWVIKSLRGLNEGHLRFIDFQKSWKYWKSWSWCARTLLKSLAILFVCYLTLNVGALSSWDDMRLRATSKKPLNTS